jgi:CubicO group peptidase (beta-lactamase class C family)
VDKRKWILVGSLAAILTIVLGLLFWPKSKDDTTSSKLEEAPFIPIEFLNEDPAWAIALVDSMSLDEKINHLIVQRVSSLEDSLGNYGGFYFDKHLPEQLAKLHPQLKDSVQPFIGMSVQSIFNDLDENQAHTILASNGAAMHKSLLQHLDHFVDYYGINYVDFGSNSLSQNQFYQGQSSHLDQRFLSWQDSLHAKRCLLSYSIPEIKDTAFKDSLQTYLKRYVNRGFAMIKQRKISPHYQALVEGINFKGLSMVEWDTSMSSQNLINSDAIVSPAPEYLHTKLKNMVAKGQLSEAEINAKVAKVLLARKWAKSDPNVHHSSRTARYFGLQAAHLSKLLQRNAITLLKNNRSLIPLGGVPDKIDLVRIGAPTKFLYNSLSLYTKVNSYSYTSDLKKIPWSKLGQRTTVIAINIDSTHLLKDSLFKSQLHALQNKCQLIVINGSDISGLSELSDVNTLFHLPTGSDYEWNFAGQLVFGGIEANGELPQKVGTHEVGSGKRTAKTRLAYGKPIDVGLDKDTLRAIRYIAEEGIRNRAYPGCQVMVTKNGFVIHDGAYGYSSYKRQVRVNSDHIYDLASVTKVAATTIASMKLYDEEKYGLYDSLEAYLPDSLRKYLFQGRSTLRHITFSELMTHQSGLPAGISYIKYVDYIRDSVKRFDRFYCDLPDDSMFYVPIAEGVFMENSYQDSIWVSLNQMWLRDTKNYLYSDANFVLLYKMMRGFLDQDNRLVKMGRNEEERDYNAFERYLQEQVYRPLKMERTVYLPRRYFSKEEIAPTEDDRFWRKQLVHGYVHDPTAALLGGISGNAGLFSTGKDMVKLFQMLMNRGYYGGTRFIKEETVNRFIRAQPGSHRGLGFNKPVGGGMYGIPEEVSTKTFGHTGFTGNSIWADPENEIIYVFLSNRSHPDAHNPKIINLGTRKRIHKSIYHAQISKDWLTPPPPELSDSLLIEEKLP